MKKFIAFILSSFVVMAALTASAFALTPMDKGKDWVAPEGITTYYAKNVSGKTPVIDGIIHEGEYGDAVRVEEPRATEKETWGNSWQNGAYDDTLASEYFDFYFAYDEENIYIAFYELGPRFIDNGDQYRVNDVVYRNNYRLCFGFEPFDMGKWFIFEGASSNSHWTELRYYTDSSIADKKDSLKTVDLISELKIRKLNQKTGAVISEGDLVSADGNKNFLNGQWNVTLELKISRKDAAAMLNKAYGTSYDDIADVMYFGLVTDGFRKITNTTASDEQYFKWAGLNDITGNGALYTDYGISANTTRDSILDLVVFEEQTEEITSLESFASDTSAPIPAGGCGGMISVCGIAASALVCAAAVLIVKKKDD